MGLRESATARRRAAEERRATQALIHKRPARAARGTTSVPSERRHSPESPTANPRGLGARENASAPTERGETPTPKEAPDCAAPCRDEMRRRRAVTKAPAKKARVRRGGRRRPTRRRRSAAGPRRRHCAASFSGPSIRRTRRGPRRRRRGQARAPAEATSAAALQRGAGRRLANAAKAEVVRRTCSSNGASSRSVPVLERGDFTPTSRPPLREERNLDSRSRQRGFAGSEVLEARASCWKQREQGEQRLGLVLEMDDDDIAERRRIVCEAR